MNLNKLVDTYLAPFNLQKQWSMETFELQNRKKQVNGTIMVNKNDGIFALFIAWMCTQPALTTFVVYSYSSQIIQNMVKNFNIEKATSWPAISKHGLGFELWTLKKQIMLNTYWPFISYCPVFKKTANSCILKSYTPDEVVDLHYSGLLLETWSFYLQ